MAFPWMLALKVIPWGDVIEHAPKVLNSARKLLDKQKGVHSPAESATPPDALRTLHAALVETQQNLQQLTQTTAELAEQNSRLVQAVELLRWRTRWLAGICALLLGAVVALTWLS
jgi:hypothetical protein